MTTTIFLNQSGDILPMGKQHVINFFSIIYLVIKKAKNLNQI